MAADNKRVRQLGDIVVTALDDGYGDAPIAVVVNIDKTKFGIEKADLTGAAFAVPFHGLAGEQSFDHGDIGVELGEGNRA